MKKIYIHIGSPKTGSTAIQNFLSQNYNHLLSKGVLYPKSASRNTNALGYSLLDFDDRPLSDINKKVDYKELYSNLKNEIEKSECENIIISSEEFFFLDAKFPNVNIPGKLSIFFGAIQDIESISIIIYLKPQFEFIKSWYKHIVTNHNYVNYFSGDFNEFYNEYKYLLSYNELIQNWTNAFGEGSVILREYLNDFNYENKLLLADFLESLRIDSKDEALIWPRKKINKSSSNKTFFLLKGINQYQSFRNKEKSKQIKDIAERIFEENDQEEPRIIPLYKLKEVMQSYSQSNAELNIKFYPNGRLFDSWNIESEKGKDSNFFISDDDFFKILASLLDSNYSSKKTETKNRNSVLRKLWRKF